MTGNPLTGELSNSKVAAIFADEGVARHEAARLRNALGLPDARVAIITARDRRPGRKLEPESEGVLQTIIRAHLLLGLVGAVLGGVAFGLLWAMQVPMIVQSVKFAAPVLVMFGAVAGLMFGGLVSLRPDHDPYINKVHDALGEGRCAVVVHAFSREERTRAEEFLKGVSGDVIATL